MKLLKMKEVIAQTGCGKTKIYAMIKADEFPRPYKIGMASRWRSDEVENWIKTRPVSWQKIKSGYQIGYDSGGNNKYSLIYSKLDSKCFYSLKTVILVRGSPYWILSFWKIWI